MPIIKSAIKRAKQSAVRRSRNLQVKRAIKQDVNALHAAIAEGGDVQVKLSAAYSELDRAVKKGTLHKNTASRKKSRLAAAVAKAIAAQTEPVEEKKPAVKKAAVKKTAAAKKPATKTAAKKPAVKKV